MINIPLNEANTDYQAIQEWIADGGTIIDKWRWRIMAYIGRDIFINNKYKNLA